MEFQVHEDVLNAVLGYLATRPYQEVAGLIKSIHDGIKPIAEVLHEKETIGSDD